MKLIPLLILLSLPTYAERKPAVVDPQHENCASVRLDDDYEDCLKIYETRVTCTIIATDNGDIDWDIYKQCTDQEY